MNQVIICPYRIGRSRTVGNDIQGTRQVCGSGHHELAIVGACRGIAGGDGHLQSATSALSIVSDNGLARRANAAPRRRCEHAHRQGTLIIHRGHTPGIVHGHIAPWRNGQGTVGRDDGRSRTPVLGTTQQKGAGGVAGIDGAEDGTAIPQVDCYRAPRDAESRHRGCSHDRAGIVEDRASACGRAGGTRTRTDLHAVLDQSAIVESPDITRRGYTNTPGNHTPWVITDCSNEEVICDEAINRPTIAEISHAPVHVDPARRGGSAADQPRVDELPNTRSRGDGNDGRRCAADGARIGEGANATLHRNCCTARRADMTLIEQCPNSTVIGQSRYRRIARCRYGPGIDQVGDGSIVENAVVFTIDHTLIE